MAKIYVSSTYQDLQEHRAQVEKLIRRMGHIDVAMEYYVAEDTRPVKKCLDDVADCDVYVGIYAWRYGWQPAGDNPDKLSVTEMEFRQAEKMGKPCFIFLLSDDAPWPRKQMDKDVNKIETLRNTASAKHTADYFANPDELARKIAEAIHKWIQKNKIIGTQLDLSNVSENNIISQTENFEEAICLGATLYEINENLVSDYLQKATAKRKPVPVADLPLQVILEELGLMREGHLTNAALLVFGKRTQHYIPQSEIRCARFKDEKAVEVIDSQDVRGTILEQLGNCENFILRNIRKGWTINGFERQEKWEYPLEAVRESLVNALVHRSYNLSGNIQIRIFDNRIEIWSPGKLPNSLTIPGLLEHHQSFPRNKHIAQCFYNLGYFERWGTGIHRILEKAKEYELPQPLFAEQINSFVVTLYGKTDVLLEDVSVTLVNPSYYYEALRKRYNVLALEGLTPPQKEEYLQIQLRSVFVEQIIREDTPPVELPKEVWEKLSREQEIHDEDLPSGITLDDVRKARDSYYQKPSRLVLDALTDSRCQYTIILGDPGSGKSTLARYVMLSLIDPLLASDKIQKAFEGYLPLLIELRTYASLLAENKCETPLEFLEHLGKTEGWGLTQSALHNHLKGDGRAVIIFDGLDEIFEPKLRETITNQIVGFTNAYPKARVIVTSRILGYRRKILSDAGFVHFTLQDLNQEQVAAFITKWYELAMSNRPDDAKERSERILKSFGDSASIRQLAGNPMLLTIMAIIGKHQELPRERWKLYDHAASVLIQHWDVNKHLKDENLEADFIGEDDKKELLRRLAYRIQSGDGGLAGNYIHREGLQEEFESYLKERYSQTPDRAKVIAEAMIQQFRERNFILSLYGANVFGFVHHAFLEYFCASAFVWKFEKTKELTVEQLKTDVYGRHWEDQSWHEVLRLICGLIDEKWVSDVVIFLVDNSALTLAIECFSDVKLEYLHQHVIKYWRNHPDTLPLLRDRAENDPTPWLRDRAKELIEEIEGKKV